MLFSEGDLARLEALFEDPAHAMMIVREGGFVADEEVWFAKQILGSESAANILKLQPVEDKKSIGVDQVRLISGDMSLGSKGNDEKRLVLISDEFAMGDSAQNALLKILEEPPVGVHFLILSGSEDFFLSTVKSRCAVVKLASPDSNLVTEFSKSSLGLSEQESSLLWLQSGGLVGPFLSLSSDEAVKTRSLSVLGDAKKFVGADSYFKVVVLKPYVSGRVEAMEFVKGLMVVLEIVASKGARETLAVSDLVGRAEKALVNIGANGNARVELLSLVV